MSDSVPLIALDAVVLDTETTGLDPVKVRILQVGAVRLARGKLAETFERKVNPGVPIPPETTKVHGLTAEILRGAPRFCDIHPELAAFAGPHVLIGHNIGFDLAVLERECALAGLPTFWTHILDTRFLGELCFPRLGGFTLDKFASHLGLDITDRHDALGDARLTAQIFLALVPILKTRNIRTLIEAEAACRRLTEALDSYSRAGWAEPVRPKAAPDSVLSRIDAFPFRHRVRDIASQPPAWIGPGLPLGAAIRVMAEKGISSVFVSAEEANLTEPIGIITERDVIRLVGLDGPACLTRPSAELANRPLETVPADAFIYRAIGRMELKHIRHLGVVDEDGAMIGAISARDLLRLRASDALALGDAIDQSQTIGDLAAAWGRLPLVARRLLSEGVTAPEVAAIISREIGALTRRASREAERGMIEAGRGPAPAAFAVLVLGSGGRGESLLIPDQDNAVIHAGDEADTPWFLEHGTRMNAILDDIGIPLCKGGVMAGQPAWNGTREAWRRRILGWTETVDPADLLAVDIFFDFRFVEGDAALAADLRQEALAAAHQARPMIKLLANQIGSWSPPLGFLGRIQTEDGRVDLKRGGLFPIVALARCLALSHAIGHRNTLDRLKSLRELKIGAERDLVMLEDAQGAFSGFILNQQIADIADGLPPTTRVELKRLSKEKQGELRERLSGLTIAPSLAHDLLFS